MRRKRHLSSEAVNTTVLFCLFLSPLGASAGEVQIFVNRYDDWLEAVNYSARIIDFETLPDGTPSRGGEQITPEFNYTNAGVTFSPPFPIDVFGIGGNSTNGHSLVAISHFDPYRAWIIADMVQPTSAVGIFFAGGTNLSAFDEQGNLLARQYYGAPFGGHFIGFVSDTLIAQVTVDRLSDGEEIEAFVFNPVPEPASATLLGVGVLTLLGVGRRRRMGQIGSGPSI